MFKPGDIVAVYGEVSHGGTLLHKIHNQPKSEEDEILKRYALCNVVSVHGDYAIRVNTRTEPVVTTLVHPRQCRKVTVGEAEKSNVKYRIFGESEDHGKYSTEIVEKASLIKVAKEEMILCYSSDHCDDDEDQAREELSFTVEKFIDVTEEFED
jgi:hypothetical protein